MLTRLEASEPTTVWFGLWDKVISERNLQAGFWAVWRNRGAAGVDGQTVPQFEAQEQAELAQLREELRSQHYRRQPARRVWIPKPGTTEKRPLGTNLRQWSEGAGLSVHPTKTRIVNVRSEGFDFLGWCGHRRLSALLKLTYG
jgi:hypothetical protein